MRGYDPAEGCPEAILLVRSKRGGCQNAGIAGQLCVSKTCASGYCSIDVVEVFPGLGDHDVRLTAVGERFAKKAFAGHRPFVRMLLDAEMSAEVVLREVRRTKHCTPADFPESPSSCLERIKDSLR